MASLALLETKANGLPQGVKAPIIDILRSLVREQRFGHPADEEAAENFAGHFYEVTTPANAGDEFTIPHGFGHAPYLLIPVLPLGTVGAQLVPLTVTRAADEGRVYLSSSVEDATCVVYVEG